MHAQRSHRRYSETAYNMQRRDYASLGTNNGAIPKHMHKHMVPARPARSNVVASSGFEAQQANTAFDILADHKKKQPNTTQSKQSSLARASAPQRHADVSKKSFSDVTPIPKKTTVRHSVQRVNKSQVLKRDSVHKPYQKTRARQRNHRVESRPLLTRIHRRFRMTRLNLSMAGALLVVSVSASMLAYGLHTSDSSHTTETQDEKQAMVLSRQDGGTTRGQQPDPAFLNEDKPSQDEIGNHRAIEAQPKVVSIPSLEISAKIIPKSVDIGNELLLPQNIYDVGWYEASRKPNQSGTVLLFGHVSGPTERGVFYYLRALEPGDEVQVTDANDDVYTYVVEDAEFVPYDEMKIEDALVPYNNDKNALNLIAYDMRFNVLSEQFQDRLIVRASEK